MIPDIPSVPPDETGVKLVTDLGAALDDALQAVLNDLAVYFTTADSDQQDALKAARSDAAKAVKAVGSEANDALASVLQQLAYYLNTQNDLQQDNLAYFLKTIETAAPGLQLPAPVVTLLLTPHPAPGPAPGPAPAPGVPVLPGPVGGQPPGVPPFAPGPAPGVPAFPPPPGAPPPAAPPFPGAPPAAPPAPGVPFGPGVPPAAPRPPGAPTPTPGVPPGPAAPPPTSPPLPPGAPTPTPGAPGTPPATFVPVPPSLMPPAAPQPPPAAPGAPGPAFCPTPPAAPQITVNVSPQPAPVVNVTVQGAQAVATAAGGEATATAPAAPQIGLIAIPAPTAPPAPAPFTPDKGVLGTPIIQPPAEFTRFPEPPDESTLAACAALPEALRHGIPSPGSREWCLLEDEIVDWLTQIGEVAIEIVEKGLDPDAPWFTSGAEHSLLDTLKDAAALPLKAAMAILRQLSKPLIEWIRDTYRQVSAWARCSTRCNARALISLTVLNGVVKAFKKLRIGWDAAVWATADLSLHAEQLEQMVEYVLASICPVEVPGVPEAIECFLKHTIDAKLLRCWLLMRGADPLVWWDVIQARAERLSPREAIQWARRTGADAAAVDEYLRQLGFLKDEDRAAVAGLYDELPTISDHLHWLQRNVFDDSYVADYHLLEGFEDRFWAKFGKDLRAQGMKKEYASLHYAAHWINASPEQMREWVFRLRPDKPGVQNPFTPDDFQRLLSEQDYNPWQRARFRETLNRLPALGYLRDMFRSYVLSDEEMAGYHRDLGYSPEDAARFVKIDKVQRARQNAQQGHGWTPAAIAKAYGSGVKDAPWVRERMTELGYPDYIAEQLMDRARAEQGYRSSEKWAQAAVKEHSKNVRAAFESGLTTEADAHEALTASGASSASASALVSAWADAVHTRNVSAGVAVVRRAVFAGRIPADQIAGRLQTLGVEPGRAGQLQALWAAAHDADEKRLAAAKVIKYLKSGLMDPGEAAGRLDQLGYPEEDQALMLQEASAGLAAAKQKADDSAARRSVRAQQDAAALAQKAKRTQEQAVAFLRRQTPPERLTRWLSEGIVDEGFFRERMAAMDFGPDLVEDYVKQAADMRTRGMRNDQQTEAPPP